MKASKIILIVFACISFVFGIFTLVYFYGDSYEEFYSRARAEIEIPGLEEGFTPQGFTYLESEELYAFSGYMNNSSMPSRVYLVDKAGKAKYFTLELEGEAYFGHAGGIACFQNLFWLASADGYVYTFYLADALNAENGSKVIVKDGFKVGNNADYCAVVGNTLWVGEFYRAGNYETDSSHHFETQDGTNKAVIFSYTINENNFAGLESVVPNSVLSVTDQVQGMTITASGRIVLSTSYSLPNSCIYIYKNVLSQPSQINMLIDNHIVPVYILDSTVLDEKISAPCMAEEIEYIGGRLYISFESACKKYSLFVREQLDRVFSLEIA